MYKYWKKEEKAGEWRQTEDDPETLVKLITNNVVRHMTVLSVDRPVTKETPRHVIKYFGDMWFDIDFKPEEVGGTKEDAIAGAIKSCQQLVSKLLGVGATGLQIYASGSKGFHVILPWKNFGRLRPQPFLYDTYRQIAVHFKVDGLDMGVYKGGQGSTLRMPNVRREGINTYKVPLTVDELSLLSPDGYLKLVSQRRIGFVFGEPEKADSLAAVFKMAREEAAKLRKEREKLSEATPKEDLAKDYKENGLPGCIDRLVTKGDEKSNFNQACMQLAAYCKDAGLSAPEVKELCRRMAKSVTSSSYRTESERYNAILSVYEHIRTSDRHFSKGGLFSVINKCGGCSLCETRKVLQGDVAIDIDERLQIAIGNKGYEIGFGKAMQPATNFHLRTKAVKVGYPVDWHNTPELRRNYRKPAGLLLEMTTFDSMGASEPVEVNLSEEAANSPMIARDVIVSSGGSWLTSPDFWSKLRMVLTDRGNLKVMNAEEITVVPHFGTSVFLRDGDPVIVYCDPDTDLLSDPDIEEVFRTEFPEDPRREKVKNCRSRMPNLANVPPFSRKMERGARNYTAEDLSKLIDSISRTLPEAEAATVLGWFCAAHIKPHLRATGVNFPLLNLYGAPESGKTASASLMLCLHGVPGTDAPVVDASQSTIVSIREKLSQSNSVPTIVDEVNQGTIDFHKYKELVNVFKSSWDHSATSKMASGGVQDKVSTSPVVTCGEETIAAEHRSLRTRTLEVAFDMQWKDDSDRRANFMYVSARKPLLASFGLDLLVEAVQATEVLWVADQFSRRIEQVPKVSGSDRKREGYAACLLGLDFLGKALKRLGADCSVRLKELEVALLDKLTVTESKTIDSNIDLIIKRIAWSINNAVLDIDPDGPKMSGSVGMYLASADKVRFLPLYAYQALSRIDRQGQRGVFKMAPEDFEKMLKSAPPKYVRMGEDGFAYISMQDLEEKGWWMSSPPASEIDEF